MTVLELVRHWKLGLIALLILVIGIQTHRIGVAQRGWDAEKVAHAQTVTNYRVAALEAEKRDLANVVRVKAEQEEITNAEVEKVLARAADADTRYQRLLAQAKAYSSRPATAGLPDTSDATCRAYAGADCEGIPALLKAAQDNTDRLLGLQAWASRQAAVDVAEQIR